MPAIKELKHPYITKKKGIQAEPESPQIRILSN